ncbi:phage tail protein [Azospirillum sp.]|uniref:phage tail protein n=1 Tax=Azospirillum sp. TaxID=34012 RepID=UPI002D52C887|nr:tail fiber protein [Azospirillum sp.]HYD69833.1 tail fiber protein [Azospirillum sp.]
MADAFIGEIRGLAFNWTPYGWAACDGGLMSTYQNQALWSIIGNLFGGNASQNTFAMPNLQGYAIVHQGQGTGLTARVYNNPFGTATVTLNALQTPSHNHTVTGGVGVANTAMTDTPSATTLISRVATATGYNPGYSSTAGTPSANMNVNTLAPYYGGINGVVQGHENRQPFLALNYCISLYGEYPVRD